MSSRMNWAHYRACKTFYRNSANRAIDNGRILHDGRVIRGTPIANIVRTLRCDGLMVPAKTEDRDALLRFLDFMIVSGKAPKHCGSAGIQYVQPARCVIRPEDFGSEAPFRPVSDS